MKFWGKNCFDALIAVEKVLRIGFSLIYYFNRFSIIVSKQAKPITQMKKKTELKRFAVFFLSNAVYRDFHWHCAALSINDLIELSLLLGKILIGFALESIQWCLCTLNETRWHVNILRISCSIDFLSIL